MSINHIEVRLRKTCTKTQQYPHPTVDPKFKRMPIPHTRYAAGNLELSSVVGENVIWYDHFGK